MTNTNFLQCGEVTACGHCQPDKYGEGLKQAIAGGFDETKCECKCHKPMTNTTWQQQFEHDFRTKVFKGMSREETTQEAVKYFTDFIESKVKEAKQVGYEQAMRDVWNGSPVFNPDIKPLK